METVINSFFAINWDAVVRAGLRILLVLVLTWMITALIGRLLRRVENRLIAHTHKPGEPPSETNKRVDTLIRLLRQGIYLILWLTVGLVILKQIGVDVAPVLASAGVLGLAVGFGAQNLVKDLIAGFFFILENQVRVGDVATVNNTGGLVEEINFRTLVLRDLAGTVHVFPNGSVTSLSNMTREWSAYVFDLAVAYKEDTDRVIEIINQVGGEMKQDPHFGRYMLDDLPELFGVDRLADSAVIIKGRLRTTPIKQWELGREFLRRIKKAFDAAGVEIPYPHRKLYLGDNLQLLQALSKRPNDQSPGRPGDRQVAD